MIITIAMFGNMQITITLTTIQNHCRSSEMLVCYLSIELHSVVCYSPNNVNRIADKLNNTR